MIGPEVTASGESAVAGLGGSATRAVHLPWRAVLLGGFLLAWTVEAAEPGLAEGTADERPLNVLFISFDDLNFDLGCYGHPTVKSPHIDAVASRGVRFDNAYCQYPQCGQSRASMLTGLRPDQTGIYRFERIRRFAPEVVTLPQWFRQHGYFVARSGKIYHMSVPDGIGTAGLDDPASWDHTHNPRGRDKVDQHLVIDFTPARGAGSSLNLLKAGGTDEEQTDGMVATEIIRLMEEHRDRPFFLAAGFFRPHCPYIAPAKWFDLYPLEDIQIPEPHPDEKWRASVPEVAHGFVQPWPWFGVTEDKVRQCIQAYHAAVSFVDGQVGRLLEALERLDLADRTVVVLWSDHGYHLGEYGYFKKQSLLDRSAGAPLIIAAPQTAARGEGCRRVVEFIDIYPTLVDLAGLPMPDHLAGRSLKPLLEDPQAEWNHAAITQVHRNQARGYSIRTEEWRYTEWNRGEAGIELWQAREDRRHLVNLADDPGLEEVRKELRSRLYETPGVQAGGW